MPEPNDDAFFSWPHRRSYSIRYGLLLLLLAALFVTILQTPARTCGTSRTPEAYRTCSSTSSSAVAVYEGFVGILIGIGLVGFARSFRIGISLTPTGVVARSTFATRHYGWGQLVRATTSDHATRGARGPVAAYATRYLDRERVKVVAVLDLTGRKQARLYGLQTVCNLTAGSWLDDAVDAINERLEARGTLTPR